MNEAPNSGNCLNPWKQPLAYPALASGILGAVVTTIPIFPMFSFLLAAFPLLVGVALGVHVQVRASGALKTSDQWLVFGLSIVPLMFLLLTAVLASNGTANSFRELAHGRQPYTDTVVLTLLTAVIPAALLVVIAARMQKARWEECLPLALYWLSFAPGAALVTSICHR